MRCKHYEKWIYLYREGELTLQERDRLGRHLETCGRCRRIESRIRQLEEATGYLKMKRPVLPESEALTDEILDRIRPVKADKNGAIRVRRPFRLQWALAGAALLLAAAFIVQQSWVYLKVSQLEARMAGVEAHPQKARLTALTAGPGQLRRLSGLSQFSLGENGNGSGEYVVIQKDVLEALLRTNHVLNRDRQRLLAALATLPEFRQIDFQDGLNFEEWRILARNQESIIDQVLRYQ